jgi:capsular polysaccharide biosynthesis protein
MNNTVTAAVGSSALTFPIWGMFLTHGWAFFIAVLGAAVLITALWKNILDVRIKRQENALLELELERQR